VKKPRLNLFDRKTKALALAFLVLSTVMVRMGPESTLDSRFFYTSSDAADYLASVGAVGRATYLKVEALDFGLITIYTLFLVRVFAASWRGLRNRWVAFVPGFFDLIETATIFLVLQRGTLTPPAYLGYVTAAKWLSVTFAVIFGIGSSLTERQAKLRPG
jgi:hypothetical protein